MIIILSAELPRNETENALLKDSPESSVTVTMAVWSPAPNWSRENSTGKEQITGTPPLYEQVCDTTLTLSMQPYALNLFIPPLAPQTAGNSEQL